MLKGDERKATSRRFAAKALLLFAILLLLLSSISLSSIQAQAADVPVVDLELDGGFDTPLVLENLKPGDMGSKSVSLRNAGDVDGEISIWVSDVQEADYAGDGAHLDDYLKFEVNCAELSTSVPMPCSIWSLPDGPTGSDYLWILNVRAGQTVEVNWYWEFVENYQSQNQAQGDSLSFDINYMLGDIPPPVQNMSWLDVNVQGRVTTALLDSEGRSMDDVVAMDKGRSLSLMIEEGTLCRSSDGYLLKEIAVLEGEVSLPVETGQALIGSSFTVSASVLTGEVAESYFDVPAVLRINYDPALLPSVTQTIGLYVHEQGSSWVPLGAPVNSPPYIGQCSGLINQSGTVGVIASFDPAQSAYFLPSDLDVVPSEQVWWDPIIFASRYGKIVTVSVVLTNIGEVAGQENVTLMVNGEQVDVVQVALGPLETREVTFALSDLEEGNYEIEVSGLSGYVAVGTEVNWWLILAFYYIALGAIMGFAYSATRWNDMRGRVDRLQSSITDVQSMLAEPRSTSRRASSRVKSSSSAMPPTTIAKTPLQTEHLDETIAAYVASSEPKAKVDEGRMWVAEEFNQVGPNPKLSAPEAVSPHSEVQESASTPTKGTEEREIALEDSVQFEQGIEARRMLIAKQFIMDKINTEGSLVVEEVPEGPSALVAISALGQLVEEGKLRIVQEPRRTVYMKNEP